MKNNAYLQIASSLPTAPGIYKYFSAANELIYVGKAKNIKKRVSSYFTKSLTNYKTAELVKRIDRIEFTIVNSESDAFLLENSLIKEYQPFYNINLKDDKTYPFLVIKKEAFSRVFFSRKKIIDGSEYLGPYTSVGRVRELLEFIKQTIPLRTCSLNLSPRNVKAGKFKVCLEYHLGNCKGPCEGLQTEEDYQQGLQQVRDFLKGNLSPIIKHFKEEMMRHAAEMAFEKAALIKHKIDFLENYQNKSLVANSTVFEADVFSIQKTEDTAFINFLMVRNGAIIQTHTARFESKLDETIEEILAFGINNIKSTFNANASEIIIPFAIDYPSTTIKITIPKGGDKKKLLELSDKNVQHFIETLQQRQRLQLNTHDNSLAILEKLQEDLQLQELPKHIECFDNSNFHGSYPVSAMVCFKNAQPSKKDYRHFNIKTVEGINDFASMKEAIYRRYKRLKEEQQPLPELVIIDGGKGQLNAALEAIEELALTGLLTLVGLAKNEEEIFFAGDSESLKLPYNGSSLLLIRRIRDEVHHFGLSHHRQRRSKGTFTNELEQIEGIGPSTANLLLQKYRSIKNIKALTEAELSAIAGKAKAAIIFRYFHQANQ